MYTLVSIYNPLLERHDKYCCRISTPLLDLLALKLTNVIPRAGIVNSWSLPFSNLIDVQESRFRESYRAFIVNRGQL